MEARAVGRYLRVPPRKARYVLDTVRGKSVKEALAILKFVPNRAARFIEKIIQSAVANAEHNYAMDRDALRISRAYVDGGPSLKRIQPRAMGRAYRILKRTSHVTVVLTEDESLKKTPTKPKGRRTVSKKATPRPAAEQKTTTIVSDEKTAKVAETSTLPGQELTVEQQESAQSSEAQTADSESTNTEQTKQE
jgi:large subunit ribosomal protein L22